MKNLESLNLQELSFEEQVNIDGGNWGSIVRAVGTLMTVAGVWDAAEDFAKGFNSVNCGCKK